MIAETPQAAARRLLASHISTGFSATALHCYANAKGEPLFYRARLQRDGEKVIRPLHRNASGWVIGEPEFTGGKPLYALDRLADSDRADDYVVVVEGEKAADAFNTWSDRIGAEFTATTSGSATSAQGADWSPLKGRCVVVWPDNDAAGSCYARDVFEILGRETEVVDASAIGLSAGGDAYDWLAARPDADAISFLDLPRAALVACDWLCPTPLPEGLPPVTPFDREMLPDVLATWAWEISEQLQVPADFPAAAIIVTLGATIGRSRLIEPREGWQPEAPNLWGLLCAPPGIGKSPVVKRAMRNLDDMQRAALEQYALDGREHEAEAMVRDATLKAARDAVTSAVKSGRNSDAVDLAREATRTDPTVPKCRRFVVNEATVEKLGEILRDNSRGVLMYRDELAGWLNGFDRTGREQDRAFYLEAWSAGLCGTFIYDRIGRGTVAIQSPCVAVLGTIQPGPLAARVRLAAGAGDDGLVQRFQVAVMPDIAPVWKLATIRSDAVLAGRIAGLYSRLAAPHAVDSGGIPDVLRFDPQAQALFDAWQGDLEHRLRNGDDPPVVVAHLAKFRKLVPAVALILHLAESTSQSVSEIATLRAISWAEYLESHARRIYSPVAGPAMDAARLLLARIKRGVLPPVFALRDIYRNGWHGLHDRERAQEAVTVLEDFGYLRKQIAAGAGRAAITYLLHPSLPRAEAAAA